MGNTNPTPQLSPKFSDQKYGRYTRSVPCTYHRTVKQAIALAEHQFKRPVYTIEIGSVWS